MFFTFRNICFEIGKKHFKMSLTNTILKALCTWFKKAIISSTDLAPKVHSSSSVVVISCTVIFPGTCTRESNVGDINWLSWQLLIDYGWMPNPTSFHWFHFRNYAWECGPGHVLVAVSEIARDPEDTACTSWHVRLEGGGDVDFTIWKSTTDAWCQISPILVSLNSNG